MVRVPIVDSDDLVNWIGDPVGSAADWTVRHVIPLFRRSRTVEVPDVVGEFLTTARTMIERNALKVQILGPAEMGSNTVVSQYPAPGTIVSRGELVTLTVASLGQSRAPSVAGL